MSSTFAFLDASLSMSSSIASQVVLTMMVKAIRCILKKLRCCSSLWNNVGEGEEPSNWASPSRDEALASVGEGSNQSRK